MSSIQRPWKRVPRDTIPKSGASRKLNRTVSEDARVTDVVLKRFREDVEPEFNRVMEYQRQSLSDNVVHNLSALRTSLVHGDKIELDVLKDLPTEKKEAFVQVVRNIMTRVRVSSKKKTTIRISLEFHRLIGWLKICMKKSISNQFQRIKKFSKINSKLPSIAASSLVI